MSNDRQAKVTLTGDASGINAAAQQGEKALGGVGAAADQTAAKLAAADAAARAFQKSQAAAGQSAAAGASGMAAGARAADGVAASNRQAAAAMRMLPAQLTDVATQLAGGANPLLILLQQGGQVKDMFGGFGPMFRGLASAITPTVIGVGALAAGIGLATMAAIEGTAQQRAYQNAIIMSGNAAGATLGKLDQMAQRIAAGGGSQGAAADALAKATASGRIASQNLEQISAVAVRMEREVGVAVDETIKVFAELGKSPAEASRTLNQQYNYLNASTYRRIKALEEQKRFEEAAALAQSSFADALADRTKKMEGNLGALESAWRAVKKEASETWDAMLNLGKKQTPEARISELAEHLAKSRGEWGGSWDKWIAKNLDLRNPAQKAAQEQGWLDEQAALQEQVRMERRAATVEAARAEATRKEIRQIDEAAKHADGMRKAKAQAEIQAIESATKLKTEALANEARVVDSQLQAGIISEAAAYQRRRELVQQEADAEVAGLAAKNAALKRQKLDYEAAIGRDAEVAKNSSEIQRVRAKTAADITVLNNQEAASLRALAAATRQYRDELDSALRSREKAITREMAGAGLGDQARDRASRRAAIDDRFEDDLRRLNAERNSKLLPDNVYDERLQALRAYYREAVGLEADYQAQRAALQSRGDLGFDRAWANWSDTTRNVYGQVEAAATRAFDGIADSMVSMAVTSKGNFTALAESVMADILRMVIRAQMLRVFDEIFGKSGGAGGFFNAAVSAVKGYFGGGSVQDSYTGAPVFHGGGVVGRDAPYAVRMQSAQGWNNAPRFHSGLATDEVRAILKKNEGVFTPEQMKQLAPVGSMGAAPRMDIRLINESGTPLQASETRQRSDGGFDVILQAAEAQMADRIGAGVGPVVGAMRSRFGLRDALV